MKQKQEAKMPFEQQLVHIGTYSGTMLLIGILYEAWHIPTGEYDISGRKALITDIYIGIGEERMIIVPGKRSHFRVFLRNTVSCFTKA